jgi:hypothetical protein
MYLKIISYDLSFRSHTDFSDLKHRQQEMVLSEPGAFIGKVFLHTEALSELYTLLLDRGQTDS